MRVRRLVLLTVLASLPALLPAAAGGQPPHLDCLIDPSLTVTVSMPVEGLLENVRVDRGDLVDRGQVLATLESSVERATVQLAQARAAMDASIKSNEVRFEFGVRRFVRTDELFKQGLVPLKDLDEAETGKILAEIAILEGKENKRVAELDLERAKAALELRTIRSPIRGVVTQRLLSPGEFAKQTPILKLAQIDPLYVEVFAPVSLLGKILVGMRAEVMPEAPVHGRYVARVKVVDHVVDAASGTFGVRIELPNPDYKLPAGLRCKVGFPR